MSKAKKRKPHDPTPAKRDTIARQEHENTLYDIENAIWELNQYPRMGISALIRAARFVRIAISQHNESEKLFGNTLEKYLEDEKK